MKALSTLMQWLKPINLFEAHGHLCCEEMQFFEKYFANQTLIAKSMAEANMVILWGSFTKKLALSLKDSIALGNKKFVLHIKGCEKRIDNQYCFSDISELLPINKTVSSCKLSMPEVKQLLKEARECLRA